MSGRLCTPWLDRWRRAPTPPGTALHRAACWEKSAAIAYAQGVSWDAVINDLVEAEFAALKMDRDDAADIRLDVRRIVLERQGVAPRDRAADPNPRFRRVGPSAPWRA